MPHVKTKASSLNWPEWRPIRAQGLESQNKKTGEI